MAVRILYRNYMLAFLCLTMDAALVITVALSLSETNMLRSVAVLEQNMVRAVKIMTRVMAVATTAVVNMAMVVATIAVMNMAIVVMTIAEKASVDKFAFL